MRRSSSGDLTSILRGAWVCLWIASNSDSFMYFPYLSQPTLPPISSPPWTSTPNTREIIRWDCDITNTDLPLYSLACSIVRHMNYKRGKDGHDEYNIFLMFAHRGFTSEMESASEGQVKSNLSVPRSSDLYARSLDPLTFIHRETVGRGGGMEVGRRAAANQ